MEASHEKISINTEKASSWDLDTNTQNLRTVSTVSATLTHRRNILSVMKEGSKI